MPVDNDVYDRLGQSWWDESNPLNVLHASITPGRSAYFQRVIGETARELKAGGLYLFDTVNRTITSKLIAIKTMQDWGPTRIFDAAVHDWEMFIKPAELADSLVRHGLIVGEMVGLGPRAP